MKRIEATLSSRAVDVDGRPGEWDPERLTSVHITRSPDSPEWSEPIQHPFYKHWNRYRRVPCVIAEDLDELLRLLDLARTLIDSQALTGSQAAKGWLVLHEQTMSKRQR